MILKSNCCYRHNRQELNCDKICSRRFRERNYKMYIVMWYVVLKDKVFHQFSRSSDKYFLTQDKRSRNLFKVCTKV